MAKTPKTCCIKMKKISCAPVFYFRGKNGYNVKNAGRFAHGASQKQEEFEQIEKCGMSRPVSNKDSSGGGVGESDIE